MPLLFAAVAFTVTLPLLGGEPAYSLLKLALLLGVPAGVFWLARRRTPIWRPESAPPTPRTAGGRRCRWWPGS
ncbi:hypothetical protein [Micromonospora sp. RTGN7]|uniref:hypothetical protein n=1 Tax=Micromonospora sp. RTGN7 TaxID=3016526 RepID=UPI0029FF039F|nr:hypothetical protein [Micromonospora sp. RTGN7]